MCRKLLILAHDLPPYSSGVGSYMRVVTLGVFIKQAGFKVILFGASKNKILIQYLKSACEALGISRRQPGLTSTGAWT